MGFQEQMQRKVFSNEVSFVPLSLSHPTITFDERFTGIGDGNGFLCFYAGILEEIVGFLHADRVGSDRLLISCCK